MMGQSGGEEEGGDASAADVAVPAGQGAWPRQGWSMQPAACLRTCRFKQDVPSGGQVEQRCYNCSEIGHIARDCPNKPAGLRPSDIPAPLGPPVGGGMGPPRSAFPPMRGPDAPGAMDGCYYCGRRGHFARECPEKYGSPVSGGGGGGGFLPPGGGGAGGPGGADRWMGGMPGQLAPSPGFRPPFGGPGGGPGGPGFRPGPGAPGDGCFECGELGHFARECPVRSRRFAERAAAAANAGGVGRGPLGEGRRLASKASSGHTSRMEGGKDVDEDQLDNDLDSYMKERLRREGEEKRRHGRGGEEEDEDEEVERRRAGHRHEKDEVRRKKSGKDGGDGDGGRSSDGEGGGDGSGSDNDDDDDDGEGMGKRKARKGSDRGAGAKDKEDFSRFRSKEEDSASPSEKKDEEDRDSGKEGASKEVHAGEGRGSEVDGMGSGSDVTPGEDVDKGRDVTGVEDDEKGTASSKGEEYHGMTTGVGIAGGGSVSAAAAGASAAAGMAVATTAAAGTVMVTSGKAAGGAGVEEEEHEVDIMEGDEDEGPVHDGSLLIYNEGNDDVEGAALDGGGQEGASVDQPGEDGGH